MLIKLSLALIKLLTFPSQASLFSSDGPGGFLNKASAAVYFFPKIYRTSKSKLLIQTSYLITNALGRLAAALLNYAIKTLTSVSRTKYAL